VAEPVVGLCTRPSAHTTNPAACQTATWYSMNRLVSASPAKCTHFCSPQELP
jgi:hypothetical protein